MSDQRTGSPALRFLVVAAAIAGAVTALALHYSISWFVGLLAGLNLATFLLYGYDKAVSGGSRLRVPENVLHLLALAGGSPGALLGQVLFRHKTVKPSFRRMYWLIVVLQVAALGAGLWYWIHPPSWMSRF